MQAWADSLAKTIYASAASYEQDKFDFWSAIPNYSDIRVFKNGLENVRIGATESRAIFKLQMFVNYALFPHHPIVAENNILFLEYIKYAHFEELTSSHIADADSCWKEWANHTILHFSQISKSQCIFPKMHSGSLLKSSIENYGSAIFTSNERHEHSHSHFITRPLQYHNGRFGMGGIISVNQRIESLFIIPDLPQNTPRRRRRKIRTENYLAASGTTVYLDSQILAKYKPLIQQYLVENDLPETSLFSLHNSLIILNSPIMSEDRVVISQNWQNNGPRSDGALIISGFPDENENDEQSSVTNYYFVLPKLLLSVKYFDVTLQVAVVHHTDLLHFPEDHILKSWHLTLALNRFSIIDISFFAKSAFFIRDFTDLTGRSFFVNSFVDYF